MIKRPPDRLCADMQRAMAALLAAGRRQAEERSGVDARHLAEGLNGLGEALGRLPDTRASGESTGAQKFRGH
jgi:hypothetical protein